MRATVLLVACLAAATACSPMSCTEAGCFDALVVELTGDVPDGFAVRFEVPGQEPELFRCDPGRCPSLVPLHRTPAEVVVVVLDLGGQELARETYTPTYDSFRPNGPGCPPECLQASVTLEVA